MKENFGGADYSCTFSVTENNDKIFTNIIIVDENGDIVYGNKDERFEILPLSAIEIKDLFSLLVRIQNEYRNKTTIIWIENRKLSEVLDSYIVRPKSAIDEIYNKDMKALVRLYLKLKAEGTVTIGYTEYKSYKSITL